MMTLTMISMMMVKTTRLMMIVVMLTARMLIIMLVLQVEEGWNATTKSGKQSKKREWEEDLVSAYNALVRDMGLKYMDR